MTPLDPDREAPGFYGMKVPEVPGFAVRLEQARQPHGRWYKQLVLERLDGGSCYIIWPEFNADGRSLRGVRMTGDAYHGTQWATRGGVVSLIERMRYEEKRVARAARKAAAQQAHP